MTKIKNYILYETAQDVISALIDKSISPMLPEGTYLVFNNDMQDCYISGYSANYDGDVFEISEKVKPEDIIDEMASRLKFRIHIT